MSHPSRGAWIEITLDGGRKIRPPSRTPRGVRGLKFYVDGKHVRLPKLSHPSRGAWIEIAGRMRDQVAAACRTPRGVRGLKSGKGGVNGGDGGAAPLAGCVD